MSQLLGNSRIFLKYKSVNFYLLFFLLVLPPLLHDEQNHLAHLCENLLIC